MKEKKRFQEKHRKLKGEVALQCEILKKAASHKERKAASQVAKAGDREAQAVMEAQDKKDKDY